MIASIDSLQRPQYAARGAVRVTVEDNGPGTFVCMHLGFLSMNPRAIHRRAVGGKPEEAVWTRDAAQCEQAAGRRWQRHGTVDR